MEKNALIQKLPQLVIQQIAAGEVVERPASVLKELVENSIDAGANQIKVEHQEGGLRWLRVSDNGLGVASEQLPLVFESHATSKIKRLEDLDELSSMGFRGEAMSAISSVARVEFWTCREGQDVGSRARVHYGNWQGVAEADRRCGSEVTVQDLFHNLPVRAKFLKSPQSEGRLLLTTLKRIALAYPEIEFQFRESGKPARLHWNPESTFDRALHYFEEEDPEHWIEGQWNEAEHPEWKVHFVFLRPRYFQSSRQNLALYLNRRMIRDKKLEFAVRRAFEGFTETPQFSTGVIFLSGPSSEVDVNVHPTKMEVRFRDPDQIFSLIVHGLRSALNKIHHETPTLVEKARSMPHFGDSVHDYRPTRVIRSDATAVAQEKPNSIPLQIPITPLTESYQFMGALDQTYWLVKKNEQLMIFDQHALHERVLYEELLAQYDKQGRLSAQRLLFPVELKFEGKEALEDNREILESLGFDWTVDAQGRWRLTSAPSILKREVVAPLKAILEGREKAKETLLRDILATIACHSALRAHDPVQPMMADSILKRFQSDDALGHCPHGRPTFIRLTAGDLEKFFHRA